MWAKFMRRRRLIRPSLSSSWRRSSEVEVWFLITALSHGNFQIGLCIYHRSMHNLRASPGLGGQGKGFALTCLTLSRTCPLGLSAEFRFRFLSQPFAFIAIIEKTRGGLDKFSLSAPLSLSVSPPLHVVMHICCAHVVVFVRADITHDLVTA